MLGKDRYLGVFVLNYEPFSKILRDWLGQLRREVSKEITWGSWRYPWMWIIKILFWLLFCFVLPDCVQSCLSSFRREL